MKKTEWFIVTLLIVMGLLCLTVSATTVWDTATLQSYVTTFFRLCLWMGLPILLTGIAYFIIIKRRKNRSNKDYEQKR